MIRLLELKAYTGDILAPSPNQDARKAPGIQGIVLHATADNGDEALSLSWLRSPRSHVSCHLLVNRAGRVTRLVGDQQRAWHAGLAWWRGTSDVNSITLGIEISNRNNGEPFTSAQYRRVASIVAHYCSQGLSLDDVVSHAEIAQGRKTDPLGWDWERFRAMVRERLQPAEEPSPVQPAIVTPISLPNLPDQRLPPSSVRPKVAPVQARVPVITTAKPVLHSRTLWVNGLMVLATSGMLAGDALDLAHRVGIVLPEHFTKWALFCLGLVNILLRLRTSRPLTCSRDGHCLPATEPVLHADEHRVMTKGAW